MKKAEIIIAGIMLIAIILNFLIVPLGEILTVLSFTALSVFYFYFGFALFNNIKLRGVFKRDTYKNIDIKKIMGAIIAGTALSLTVIGIMFKIQSWPGGVFTLMVGIILLFTVTIIGWVKFYSNGSGYYKRILIRAAIIGGLGILFFIAPKYAWMELKYRNHPAYIDAVKLAREDPDNQELWERVDIEREKVDE